MSVSLIQINNVKKGDIVAIEESSSSDLDIRDSSDITLVSFKDGHLKTKNFDSSRSASDTTSGLMSFTDKIKLDAVESGALVNDVNSEDDVDSDLSISDENKNVIAIFSNGHIRTKNFNSRVLNNIENKVSDLEEQLNFLTGSRILISEEFSESISSNFNNNLNWSISNNRLVSSLSGLSNRLQSKICLSLDKHIATCRFTVYNDTVFAIGWKVPTGIWSYCSSLIGIDAANSRINIYDAWIAATLPNVREYVNYTFINGREYILKIRKDEHKNYASVIDCVTGIESEEVATTQTSNSDAGLNEFAGGRLLGYISIVHIDGTSPSVSYLKVVATKANPFIIVYGDSITLGARLYNDELSKSYVDLLRDEFGEDRVYASAMDGAKISHIIPVMAYEIPILKPKFVMVSIGTNGDSSDKTQEQFLSIKDLILSLNSIPIINVPAMTTDIADFRPNILAMNVPSARFDIATAINNDVSQGKNSSLYADNGHPNPNGHLEMFKRFLVDTDILFDN